jgi:serine/threonine protein kinase
MAPGETTGDAVTVGPLVGEGASRLVAAGHLTLGQAFGPRYHIMKLLGAGGMGAVYQAWDAELGVAVAVKVIRRDPWRESVSSDVEKHLGIESADGRLLSLR